MINLKTAISNKPIILIIFFLLAMAASIQSLLKKEKTFEGIDIKYTHYNNYIIFKQSYFHLVEKKDLYIEYPKEQWDLYKYSPTFSVFFGTIAYLPDFLGLTIWNLLNALLLVVAVYLLPKFTNKQKGVILLAVGIELMTSMQNAQSNGLMAGLLILSFSLLERKHFLGAAFCIVFSAYIKLFGIIALVLFLFYPQKWKLALYSILWTIVLFLLPLFFIDIEQLIFLYKSWNSLLANDHSASLGFSVMGWLNSWFCIPIHKSIIVLIGACVFLVPLIRYNQYNNFLFKLLILSSTLIWIVIFNHKAESPTFIIAMMGASIWFFSMPSNKLNQVLFLLALIFTSLSPTDLFPKNIRVEFFQPYVVKAVPCILIWIKIIYDLLFTELIYQNEKAETF